MTNHASSTLGPECAETGYSQLPEAVSVSTLPEVVPSPSHVYSETVNYSTSYPEVVSPPAYPEKESYLEATTIFPNETADKSNGRGDFDHKSDAEAGAKAVRAVNDKPRVFVLTWQRVLALFVAVAIVTAAVVGGVVGSKANSRGTANNQDTSVPVGGANATSGSETTSVWGTPTTTAATSAATGASATLAAPVPAIVAAVESASGKRPSIQVFYQAAGSTSVAYSTYSTSTSFNTTNKLDLSSASSFKAPMALVSKLDASGDVSVTLFYMSDIGNDNGISKAEILCRESYSTCLTMSTSVITTNATHKIHPQSGLAAVWLGDSGIRVYYQSVGGTIVELDDTSKPDHGWIEQELKASAATGSRIAVTWAAGPKVSLFFTDAQSKLPSELVYDGGWKSAVNIASESPTGWSVASSITACYVPTPDTFRFYYTNIKTGTIVEYIRSGSDTTWTKSGSSKKWSTADSGVAAVGWLDQVRLYYTSSGEVKQSILGNGTWASTVSIG